MDLLDSMAGNLNLVLFRNCGDSRRLAELEAKQTNLGNNLLRISGAIQVLEELLVEHARAAENKEHVLETNQNSHTSLQDDGKATSREL